MGEFSIQELTSILAMQGFAGISLFSVLLLMALGLAIIFGQMGVINMAHGEFMAMGAYTTYLLSVVTQTYFPEFMNYYFLVAIVASFLVAGLFGYITEFVLIRHLYKRPLDTLLATWGLSLIMQQSFRSIFGAREVSPTLPDWLMGSWMPTETIFIPINGMFVLALTAVVTIGVYILMFRSTWGLNVRATTQNRVMSGAVGINTKQVDRLTFASRLRYRWYCWCSIHHNCVHRTNLWFFIYRRYIHGRGIWWCSQLVRHHCLSVHHCAGTIHS